MSAKQQKRYQQWLDRRPPIPVAILGIDGGETAGATLLTPRPFESPAFEPHTLGFCRTIDIHTRRLEQCIDDAIVISMELGVYLVVALETWGRGGMRGIDQWIGLGMNTGPWKREVLMRCGDGSPLRKSRAFVWIQQSTWRSTLIPDSGWRDAQGVYHANDDGEWKRAAVDQHVKLYRDLDIDSGDAAESSMVATFATRSDEVRRLVPDTYLRGKGYPVDGDARKLQKGKERV